jgi:FMN phosphatase YigB (HAD superfamily)
MSLSLVFFDLIGALIDPDALARCYPDALARALRAHFGGELARWREAVRGVLTDWDSYYADLNLSGEDGTADLWEGMLRVTRGYLRLAGMPEPDPAALTALARALPGEAAAVCAALLPGALSALRLLESAGIRRGITTYLTADHARGLLRGGGALRLIDAPILTPETVKRFDRDQTYFAMAARRAGVEPASCLLISAELDSLAAARAAGMRTARRAAGMTPLDALARALIRHGSSL